MAKLHLHPVGILLLFLGLLVWVIALGGLAASTKYCNETSTFVECSQTYQQEWWSIWLEFFLLIIMLVMSFLNVFQKARYIFLSYLCIATALLSFTTKNMYTQSFDLGFVTDWANYKDDAFVAAGVGCMFLCMVNFGLIVFIGVGAAKQQEPQAQGFSSVSMSTGVPTGMGNAAMAPAPLPAADGIVKPTSGYQPAQF